MKLLQGEKVPLIFFLAPALIIYAGVMVYPLINTLVLSLFESDKSGVTSYVGLSNYKHLFYDDLLSASFYNALKNNLYFFFIHLIVQNPIALAIAAVLSIKSMRGVPIYRTLIFFPTLLSFVLVGFIWKLILSPLWGISENFMQWIGLGSYYDAWLGSESAALTTVSLISVWQFIGIPMILIYAALISIPDDLSEAAYCDGLNDWNIFWKIKLPLVLPTLGIVSILTFVGNFNAFDLIYVIQGAIAGPNFSTDILGTLLYRTFFGFQLQLGNTNLGASLATVMFFIILAGVLSYLFLIQNKLRRYQF